MNFTFTFAFEVGIAIALLLVVFWGKPEYGLFAYGAALGLPDLAVTLGTAINLRLDDALIVFFLLRSFLWSLAPLTPAQRSIVKWQMFLAAACSFSALVGFASGAPPAAYETIKMIGCVAILIALPRLLLTRRRFRFLVAGLMCGGIALVVQIAQRLRSGPATFLGSFQELKNAAAFSTWNPNTIGQASMLLAFAAGLGWIVFRKSRIYSAIWLGFATVFSLIPTLVFAFDRWNTAVEAIRNGPFLGRGFGQEWIYLSGVGSEGRAHNAYMTVCIELGFGGLALLLFATYQFISNGMALFKDPEFHACGALLIAMIATVCMDSLASSTLYWEKLPTIALSIGIALIGICERNRASADQQDTPAAAYEALPQHSSV